MIIILGTLYRNDDQQFTKVVNYRTVYANYDAVVYAGLDIPSLMIEC